MKHSEATLLVNEMIDGLETVPSTKQKLDLVRGKFRIRDIVRGELLAVLWGEFGPFEDQTED